MCMRGGDLVTVLPYGGDTYLVVGFLREADSQEAQQELGPLWMLYSEHRGNVKMHEKYIEVINGV